MVTLLATFKGTFNALANQPYASNRMGDNQAAKTIHQEYLKHKESFDPSILALPVFSPMKYRYMHKTGDEKLWSNKIDELKELASNEIKRLMYFLDIVIALKGDLSCFGIDVIGKGEQFTPSRFELQFGTESPRSRDIRFAYEENHESKLYRFFNFNNTIAELKINKQQPDQVTYTRKISCERDNSPEKFDCSRGRRIVYQGDLHGQGEVAFLAP